jgi:hypothetical protein
MIKFPIFLENSKIPIVLSKISPIEIEAITLGPFILCRGEISDRLKNHESIHWEQYKECLIIGFLFLYAMSYIINIFKGQGKAEAYSNIWFEKEAYDNEENLNYLKNRKRYNWISNKV